MTSQASAVVFRQTVPRKPGLYETDICLAFVNAHTAGDQAEVDRLHDQLRGFLFQRLRENRWHPFLPNTEVEDPGPKAE